MAMSTAPKPVAPVDYAAYNLAWAALAVALLASTKGSGPEPRELPVLGLATFALSKGLAKEKAGTWAREPLTQASANGRRPKGTRLKYVAGELITCTRCLGTWGSLGLVGLRVARPREGQIVAGVLAVAGINDFLQALFARTAEQANIAIADADRADNEAKRARKRERKAARENR